MTSEKTIARWARAEERMSKRWSPLGLLHDVVDGAQRRRHTNRAEDDRDRGRGRR